MDNFKIYNIKISKLQKIFTVGFPSGSVMENPPSSVGDMGPDPWFWKIPHATELWKPVGHNY